MRALVERRKSRTMKPRFTIATRLSPRQQTVPIPRPEHDVLRELAWMERDPESMEGINIDEDPTLEQNSSPKEPDSSPKVLNTSPKEPNTSPEEPETLLLGPQAPTSCVTITLQSLPMEQPFEVWKRHANALVHSHEMSAFIQSSRVVVLHVTEQAIQIVCLPVTVPLHVISNASGAVAATCTHVFCSTRSIFDKVVHPVGQKSESYSLMDGILHHVTHALPLALHVVGKVKDNVGGTIMGMVAPLFGNKSNEQTESPHRYHSSAGQSSSEQGSFFDRLCLEYPETGQTMSWEEEHEEEQEQPHISPSDTTKYLLRVGDFGIVLEADLNKTVLYIDLSEEFANAELTGKALERMANVGLSLVNTCIHTALLGADEPTVRINWKPEGSTGKILKRLRTCNSLEKETLIWSGKFISSHAFRPDVPLFLSRGIVPGSPRSFLDLLWDSSRTGEYNHFCLGRSNLVLVEPFTEYSVDSGETYLLRGAKVVKSETKVPFTGITVVLLTLMHARQLDENTFMIVSRSLNSGRAGHHTSTRHVQEEGKNELFWGVNLLRPVPGKPNMTDLTSISQVRTTLVPHFLASRVGLMGVESVFEAFRARNADE